MFIYITLKQTRDANQYPCDTLEQAYLNYFTANPLTPKNACFLPIPNHLDTAKNITKNCVASMIVITGGNSIDPQYLNTKQMLDDLAPARDEVEKYLYNYAISKNIPILAICRGFQFVNILSGRKLTLELKDHPPGQPHNCTYEEDNYQVNSFHRGQVTSNSGETSSTARQSLNPLFVEWLMGWPPGWTLLAWTDFACSETALSLYRRRMRSALSQLGLPAEAPPAQLALFA